MRSDFRVFLVDISESTWFFKILKNMPGIVSASRVDWAMFRRDSIKRKKVIRKTIFENFDISIFTSKILNHSDFGPPP